MAYLKPRADADEDEQVTGEFEAWAILHGAFSDILNDYRCHFCLAPIARRQDKFCSAGCWRADHEGL